MVASAVSTLVARGLYHDSIYTEKLTARGINLDRREDMVLRGVTVKDVMQTHPPTVSENAPLDAVLASFLESDLGTVFVIDSDGHLVGQVSLEDVKQSLNEGSALGGIAVAGDVTEHVATTRPDTSVADAVDQLSREGREVLAVVGDDGRLQGALPSQVVMNVFAREALHREWIGVASEAGTTHEQEQHLRLSHGLEVRALPVPAEILGETSRTLNLRSRWRLSAISVRRSGVDEGVDPDHPLAKGDVLVLMGHARDFESFARDLAGT